MFVALTQTFEVKQKQKQKTKKNNNISALRDSLLVNFQLLMDKLGSEAMDNITHCKRVKQ